MLLPALEFLATYERWATLRILDAAEGIEADAWSRPATGERGIGHVLVHQLGAFQRWHRWLGGNEEQPEPEREPLIALPELRDRWEVEWDAMDAWLRTLTPADLERLADGVELWKCVLHVFNHGTQHRSEVAALLTDLGRSPGNLDLIDYAEGHATSVGG